MKQTNNAIKFLMAQYRAVFKRAFLSNLGLAVAVTAGLTAGAANADVHDKNALTGDVLNQDKSATYQAYGNLNTDTDRFKNLAISGTAANVNGFNGKIEVIGGFFDIGTEISSTSNFIQDASLTGDGSLIINTKYATEVQKNSNQLNGLSIVASNFDTKVSLNTIKLDSGNLNILANSINASTQSANTANKVTVEADEIIVEGTPDNKIVAGKDTGRAVVQIGDNKADINTTGEIVFGKLNKDSGTGTILTITGKQGFVDINGSKHDSGASVLAKEIKITDGGSMQAIVKAQHKAFVEAQSITMNGGNFNIDNDNSGSFTLSLIPTKNADGSSTTGVFDAKSGIFRVDGVMTLKKGTIAMGNDTIFASVDTKQSNRGLVINAGIESFTQAKLATAFDAENKTSLKISSQKLADFIKGGVSISGTTTTSGSIVIQSGGMIEFTDAVDLANFDYDSGSSLSGGKLVVSGGVISAQDMTVSDHLKSGATTINNLALHLKADNLTLGNANYDSTDTDKSLGFASATAKNVEFISKNNEFVFKDTLTLENTSTIKDQDGKDLVVGESGSITGDVTVATDGQINVKGGFYTADQITLSGGSVTVSDPTKTNEKLDDVVSSLNIDTLKLTAGGSIAKATNSGSVLTIGSITTGDVATASGTISASNGGIVNLQADDVSQFFQNATGKVKFSAEANGTLAVDGDLVMNVTKSTITNTFKVLDIQPSGTLTVDSFTLNYDKEENDTNFDINVQGTVKASSLSFNLLNGGSATNSSVSVSRGDYYVYNSLSTVNDKFTIADLDEDHPVNFHFGEITKVEDTDYYNPLSANGQITAKTFAVGKSGSAMFNVGDWSAYQIEVNDGGKVTVGALNGTSAYEDKDGNALEATLKGTKLTMTGGNLDINSTGAATFTAVETTGGLVTVNGEMTINGGAVTEEDKTNEIKLGSGTVKVNQNGELVIRDAALTNSFFGTDYAVKDNVKNGISVGSNGIVKLDFAGGEISLDQLKQIKTDLFGATNGQIDGVLNIGKAQIGGLKFENDNTITWDNLKPVSDVSSDVTNEKLLGAKVTGVDSPFKSHVGSIDSKNQRVEINGNSSLNNAADNGGMFASYNGEVANVNITNGSDLTLRNEGSIGEITLKGAVDNQAHLYTDGVGKVTIANVSGDSGSSFSANTETLVTKDVKAGEVGVDANGSLEVQGKLTATNDLYNEGKLAVVGDAKVEKDFSTSGQASFENSLTVSGTADVFGNTTVNAKATFNSDVNIGGDATLKADEIVLKDVSGQIIGNVFAVGKDNYEFNGETVEGSTGYLEANSFKLAGNTLIVDPAYGKKTSIAAIKSFTTNNNKVEYAGIVNGKLIVGQNAALMLGKDASIAKMQEFIAQYQDGNGSLQADNVGSVVYLTDKLTLNSGSRVILDSERSHSDILGTKGNIGSLYDNTYKAQFNGTGTDLEADLYIGSNTVLAAGDKILTQGGAIHFDKTDASIMAGGDGSGKVVLVGDGFMNSRNITLFTDNGDSTTNSEGVKVLGTNDIRVESLNGLMYFDLKAGTETTGGTLELDISKTRNAFLGASAPMRDFLIAYASKTNNWSEYYRDTTNVARDYLVDTVASPDLATWDKDTNTITLSNEAKKMGLTENDFVILNDGTAKEALYRMAHNSFLERVVRNSDGAAADQASRMGVFGGAAQAALSSAAASYEAISGRFGVGLNYNLTAANNGQGAGMWVSPIYKSYDSDGFATQGQNYGADVDLYGVALGGDYTMSNGLRFGAMFNVGGGDADGNGFAAGISNDFNYYGFGLYAGYAYDKFSVVADITYTVVDSDVDANTDIEKVSTSFDTDSLSLGVTGQYKLDLNGMSVTPHAGLRFTRLDMDSYNINGTDGKIGEFDTSSANVFSVPVGVTFAKEFQGEEWSVQPSFDLTLTGNFGDDDLDGSVRWTGVSRTVSSNTEFIDSFTYGATVGLSATNGNFSFGAGLNYTGSSNTDEFGINATARFLF